MKPRKLNTRLHIKLETSDQNPPQQKLLSLAPIHRSADNAFPPLMKKNAGLDRFTRYATDVVAIVLAWTCTIGLHLSSIELFGMDALKFVVLGSLCWFLMSLFSKLYANRRSNKFSEEIVFIGYHIILFLVSLSSLFFFLQQNLYSFTFFFIFLCYLFFFATIFKYILRKSIHSALYHGKLYDKILLVGATPAAWNFYETVNKFYYYGYKCVGFVDNTSTASLNGCPYYGSIADLDRVLKSQPIDEVVVALPNGAHKEIRSCLETCDYHRVSVRILPDFYQYTSSVVQMNNIGMLPVLNVNQLPLDRIENKIIKRVFDILFSVTFFLTAGLILFPLIALLIKLTSRGPVFFKQERWGLNNAKITCYKFRTMVTSSKDIDEQGKYNQATKDDPRVTPIGKLLRTTNLDELPQFLNVLMGNMSVVGPRPHPTPLNLESMHTVDNYMLRHIVLPGITGWAQVNGFRGETKTAADMQKRVDFDLYYIHRWTFWLDCQIILQTVINLLRGDQNAY